MLSLVQLTEPNPEPVTKEGSTRVHGTHRLLLFFQIAFNAFCFCFSALDLKGASTVRRCVINFHSSIDSYFSTCCIVSSEPRSEKSKRNRRIKEWRDKWVTSTSTSASLLRIQRDRNRESH